MKILLGAHSYSISEPFFEGHSLSGPEAGALNGLRASNIRRAIWNKANREGLTTEAELSELVAEYDAGYSFSTRKTTAPKISRIEVEQRLVAEELVTVHFNRAALEPSGEDFEVMVEEFCQDSRVREEAIRRLDIKSRVAEESIEDLLA
jgi:hypothetical protein